ncbi:MAG: RMD1 family protein [Kofleriaceae bacterium]
MDTLRDLGPRFDVCALNLADRLDVKGLDPRLSSHLPVTVAVGEGCAMLFRSGVVVFFGVDNAGQVRFTRDLEPRMTSPYKTPEVERAVVRIGESDAVEPDALILKESTVERLQVVAEILAKSVVLARNEQSIREAFHAIEPLARSMQRDPTRLPWRQRDLVRQMGIAMLAEHTLVDRAEVIEKPELLWDRPDLDRLYARFEDEYEIRERHHILERKLSVVASAARTMLDLTQSRRAISVELWIVGLIVFEVILALGEKVF